MVAATRITERQGSAGRMLASCRVVCLSRGPVLDDNECSEEENVSTQTEAVRVQWEIKA
jgi:hypothetical protein